MFIVVEGIDLVGKSVQHGLLVEYLRRRGRLVSECSFPDYDSPTGEAIRDHLRGDVALTNQDDALGLSNVSSHDALAFQCLQVVDKYAVAPEISRELAEGRTVVACRWWQSAHAYGLESGLDREWVGRTVALLPRADVNVLLDLDPARARRRPGVPLDRLEARLALQERVRQRYLALWRRESGDPGFWAVVDAGGSEGEVHGRVLAVLKAAGVLDVPGGRGA
jgi:thymidylate kinase